VHDLLDNLGLGGVRAVVRAVGAVAQSFWSFGFEAA
jgi:hypothetical protein